MKTINPDRQRVEQYWDRYSDRFAERLAGMQWTEAGREINRYINRRVSGDPAIDWVEHSLRAHLGTHKDNHHCLSLGCGNGDLERRLAQQKAFVSCDAYDISEVSIDRATEIANRQGITNINFQVADIENLQLPDNHYDSVWVSSALHHFTRLEEICGGIRAALRADGIVILHEYIGPNRFQFSEREMQIANHCLGLLPERYRRKVDEAVAQQAGTTAESKSLLWLLRRAYEKTRDGTLTRNIRRQLQARRALRRGEDLLKAEVEAPTVRDVTAADPSEAVRSQEILPVVSAYFDIVEKKDIGGTILHFLLAGIAGNFNDEDDDSQALLRMLINIEETLIETGDISSHFAYLAARQKV